jgi:hypothetical protein
MRIFASPSQPLTPGLIDEVQRLHVRTFPLGEHARRIVYAPHAKAYIVAVVYMEGDDDENDTFQLKMYDESTFELLDMSFRTAPCEIVNSMHCTSGLGRDARTLIIVTTAGSSVCVCLHICLSACACFRHL